ncbi:hypothetical protein KJ865_01605, partial [Myxococcota bacterium]|nr:hypothetical protein [Myxococcota bacterium]
PLTLGDHGVGTGTMGTHHIQVQTLKKKNLTLLMVLVSMKKVPTERLWKTADSLGLFFFPYPCGDSAKQ